MSKKIPKEIWIERFVQVHNTKEYFEIHGHNHYDYSLIKEIGNLHLKISVKCIEHEYVFNIRTSDHYHHKVGCPKCGGYLALTNQEIDNKLKEKNLDIKIKRVSDVVDSRTLITWECVISGCRWESRYDGILGKRIPNCPHCSGKFPLSNEEVDKRLKNQNRDHLLERISDILGSVKKNWWKCKICDYKWLAKPNGILAKRGCPHCKLSKGELEISKILTHYKIEYKIEYPLNDLVNPLTNNLLYFDFAIFSNGENLLGLVEYQGHYHYKVVEFNGRKRISNIEAKSNFEYQQYRDQLKRDYCKAKNIPLIEIPYWEYDAGNLEIYLFEQLEKLVPNFKFLT